jgi:hypothetical protein
MHSFSRFAPRRYSPSTSSRFAPRRTSRYPLAVLAALDCGDLLAVCAAPHIALPTRGSRRAILRPHLAVCAAPQSRVVYAYTARRQPGGPAYTMTEPKHTYPALYGPGTSWCHDIAWDILDRLPVGVLSGEQRSFLAGLIAGELSRERASRMWPSRFPPRQTARGEPGANANEGPA